MKPCTHIRRGREIRCTNPKDAQMYASINQAKKASHAIQIRLDKGLGLGSLKVMPYMPKRRRRKRAGKFNVR